MNKIYWQISNLTLLFIGLFIYLIWMDVALYIKLQQLLPLSKRPDRPRDGPFSPFEPITIKLLMSCPMSQFVYLPLCDWFEAIFNVSPLATPNTISIIGLFLGMS